MASMGSASEFSIRCRRVRGGGLRAAVSGHRTFESTCAYWQEIARHVRDKPPRWLLVCDELRGPELSAEEWCRLVATLAGQGLEEVRIAHVKPAGLAQEEHCEICAREIGFDARAFDDIAVAERWLRYGTPERDAGVAAPAPGR